MASNLELRGITGYVSANVGKCQTTFLYSGPNLTPHAPQISGSVPVTVERIVRLLEDGLDFVLNLGDAEAAVEAIMGMAAVQGLAADRVEVTGAVTYELKKLEK